MSVLIDLYTGILKALFSLISCFGFVQHARRVLQREVNFACVAGNDK